MLKMAPTLVASRTALPPEGALFSLGRPCGKLSAPTLGTLCTSLPREGALLSLAAAFTPVAAEAFSGRTCKAIHSMGAIFHAELVMRLMTGLNRCAGLAAQR